VNELLTELRRRDITIWREGDNLRFSAPPGAMTSDLRAQLAAAKSILLEGLAAEAGGVEPIPRAARDRDLPLSFSQEQLWVLDCLEPGMAMYNVSSLWRLAGTLDVAALERSLDEIARRHEILRTNLVAGEDAYPVQVIHPFTTRALPVIPATAGQLGALASRESGRGFNLASDTLWRATLFRVTEEEHALCVSFHHTVCDAWSLGVFSRELELLYPAFRDGVPSPLPELPIQYADFAIWQRTTLSETALEPHLAYWRRQLAGERSPLTLPGDRPRLARQSFRGAICSRELPARLTEALSHRGRELEATPFVLLLAAFKALLARLTGETDICAGSPVAQRTQVETEGLIGLFLNMLALRSDLSGDPDFREVLRRVRATVLDGFEHQEVSFERLVEKLCPKRELSYNPLFQVAFVLLPASLRPPALPKLKVDLLPLPTTTAKFDLTLFIEEGAAGMRVYAEYSTDQFDTPTIDRLLASFELLLEKIAAAPETSLSQLPVLPITQPLPLPLEGNPTARTPYPREATIQEIFEEQARKTPSAIAIVFGELHLTYDELNRRANQLARRLRQLEVGRDVPVGVCMKRSVEMILALLAVLKAGGAYVPLDPSYPVERRALMMEDTAMSILLTDVADRAAGPSIKQVICLEEEDLTGFEETNLATDGRAEDLCYIMYTSGSTGAPKGVAVMHRGVVRLVKETNYASFAGETFLQLAPISFDASTFEIWGALLNGGKLVVMPPAPPTLQEIGSAIRENGVTTLWLTAGLFNAMVDERLEDLRPLRQLLAGGDVLSVSHVSKALRALTETRLINGYGPTESTTFACCHAIPANAEVGDSIPIGKPIANTTAYVLDAQLHPVPVGVTGELFIGGDGLARGYWKSAELTAEKFITAGLGSRLYRTGDLARWREDGAIDFIGRVDTQVKLRGFRIELGEIENALRRQPDVRDCAVAMREDNPGDKQLVAYVVRQANSAHEWEQALIVALKKSLPDYMVPSAIVAAPALPRTANGKLDRNALPAPNRSAKKSRDNFVAPTTPLEKQVAAIWQEVLGLERASLTDNFFDLGGDSLLLMAAHAELNRALDMNLPVTELFQFATVSSLAKRIGAKGGGISVFAADRDRANRQREAIARRKRAKAGANR